MKKKRWLTAVVSAVLVVSLALLVCGFAGVFSPRGGRPSAGTSPSAPSATAVPPGPSGAPEASPVIPPAKAVPVALTITHQPDRVTYVHGEIFNPAGMTAEVSYSDGSSRLTEDFVCSPLPLALGQKEVAVSYRSDEVTVTDRVSVTVGNRNYEVRTPEELSAAMEDALSKDTVTVFGMLEVSDSVRIPAGTELLFAAGESVAGLRFSEGIDGFLLSDGAQLEVRELAIEVSGSAAAFAPCGQNAGLSGAVLTVTGCKLRFCGADGAGIRLGAEQTVSSGNLIKISDTDIGGTGAFGSSARNFGIALVNFSDSEIAVESSSVSSEFRAVFADGTNLKLSGKDSFITGHAAAYLGGSGITADFTGTTLVGRTVLSPESNTSGALVLAGRGAVVTMNNCAISNRFEQGGCSNETGILFDCAAGGGENRVYLDTATYRSMSTSDGGSAPEMVLTANGGGSWFVDGAAMESPVREGLYVSALRGDDSASGRYPARAKKTLAAAFSAAEDGETVYCMDGEFAEDFAASQSVTLLGNGCRITGRLEILGTDGGAVTVKGAVLTGYVSVAGAPDAVNAPAVSFIQCEFLGGSLDLTQTNENEESANALNLAVRGCRFSTRNTVGGIIRFTEEGTAPRVRAEITGNTFLGEYDRGCIMGGVCNAVISENLFDCNNLYSAAVEYDVHAGRTAADVDIANNVFKTSYAVAVGPYNMGRFEMTVTADQAGMLLPKIFGNTFECSQAEVWYAEQRYGERLIIDLNVLRNWFAAENGMAASDVRVYEASPYQPGEVG